MRAVRAFREMWQLAPPGSWIAIVFSFIPITWFVGALLIAPDWKWTAVIAIGLFLLLMPTMAMTSAYAIREIRAQQRIMKAVARRDVSDLPLRYQDEALSLMAELRLAMRDSDGNDE